MPHGTRSAELLCLLFVQPALKPTGLPMARWSDGLGHRVTDMTCEDLQTMLAGRNTIKKRNTKPLSKVRQVSLLLRLDCQAGRHRLPTPSWRLSRSMFVPACGDATSSNLTSHLHADVLHHLQPPGAKFLLLFCHHLQIAGGSAAQGSNPLHKQIPERSLAYHWRPCHPSCVLLLVDKVVPSEDLRFTVCPASGPPLSCAHHGVRVVPLCARAHPRSSGNSSKGRMLQPLGAWQANVASGQAARITLIVRYVMFFCRM